MDATVDTFVSGPMNAAGVAGATGVLVVGVLVAAELDLVLLLELPHPDSASAASGTARISFFLHTGFVLSFGEPGARARGVDGAGSSTPLGAMTPKPSRSFPTRSQASAGPAIGCDQETTSVPCMPAIRWPGTEQ